MKESLFYILNGKEVVECPSVEVWADWVSNTEMRVALDRIDDIIVSTIFLGCDYSILLGSEHQPLVFETLVHGGKLSGRIERYHFYDEAIQGHKEIVSMVKAAQKVAEARGEDDGEV